MKHIYADIENHATANLMQIDALGGWLITGIDVYWRNRHRGVGSALLTQITDDADDENVVLFLAVSPDGSRESLDEEQLINWYSRYGFILSKTNNLSMKRQPRKLEKVNVSDDKIANIK